jgi:hypothetical protein
VVHDCNLHYLGVAVSATTLIAAARAVAELAVRVGCPAEQPTGQRPARWFAIGDPQTSFDHFIAVLAARALLKEDGRLRPEVGLVCMGDHFDFGAADALSQTELEAAGREGLLILCWLAAHHPSQITILFGNHDAARVMELCSLDDRSFSIARALALRVHHSSGSERKALEDEFRARFPAIPNAEVARRDFSTFHSAQRTTLERLLTAGRLRLATVGVHRGREVLLTHAGITYRELELLGLRPDAGASAVAEALNLLLEERVGRAAPSWQAGVRTALDLSPLHVTGVGGREAGGLLAHRPAHPNCRSPGEAADLAWEFDHERPRRFEPRSLPLGLVQAAGHTRGSKSARELAPWATGRAAAARPGKLRSLRVSKTDVVYDTGLLDAQPGDALLYLLDVDLHEAPAAAVELLELSRIVCPCGDD